MTCIVHFVIIALAVTGSLAAEGRNFYEILGVDKGADDKTIKKAYRKQAL